MNAIRSTRATRALAALLTLAALAMGLGAHAASHREAPLIALDPPADLTDVYFFRSWEDPSRVVMIMNVIPGQEPGSGPNYFSFDDQVAYRFNLDVNGDGSAEDVVIEIRFQTEVRGVVASQGGLGLPVSYAAVPPITALDGPGSEGFGLRQRYTVTRIQSGISTPLSAGDLLAVPSNVGPRTMPQYEALAAQGLYPLVGGGRVFAGQRDETFYIDLGAVFDTVNLRRPLPILSGPEDEKDGKSAYGVDHLSGFNINTIAVELPIASLTGDPNAVLGLYASTSRPQTRTINQDGTSTGSGPFLQVSRLGNPLVNELIIATDQKDRWNALDPSDEAQFVDFYLNPRLATVLNLLFGTTFPAAGRTDLVAALLQYPGAGQPGTCSTADPCSELLRLNLAVPPTPPAAQERLGLLAGDGAGFPNGRRPNDDVTDIALRVVAGALLGPVPRLGDGVNLNAGAPGSHLTKTGIYTIFPFLPTPHDGRNRRHIDCGEGKASNPCR
jgi:hypothetical protein